MQIMFTIYSRKHDNYLLFSGLIIQSGECYNTYYLGNVLLSKSMITDVLYEVKKHPASKPEIRQIDDLASHQ